jgi:hypothetical protein
MTKKIVTKKTDVEKWAIDDSVEFLPAYLENTGDINIIPIWEAAIKWNSTRIVSMLVDHRGNGKFWKRICKEKRGEAIRFYLNAHATNRVELDGYHGHGLSLEMRRFILTLGFNVPLSYKTISNRKQRDQSLYFHLTIGGVDHARLFSDSGSRYHLHLTPFCHTVTTGSEKEEEMNLYCLYDNAIINVDSSILTYFNNVIFQPRICLLFARGQIPQEQVDELLFNVLKNAPLKTYLKMLSWGMKFSEELGKYQNEIFSKCFSQGDEQKIDYLLSVGMCPTSEYFRLMEKVVNKKVKSGEEFTS